MKKMARMLLVALAAGLLLGRAELAQAFYFELTNGDGALDTSADYYTIDVYFDGLQTDNLNDYSLTIAYNNTLLSYAGTILQSYDDGGGFFANTTWEEVNKSHDVTAATIKLDASEPIINQHSFYPVAVGQTLMGTIYFTALTDGTFTDIASFLTTGSSVQLNGEIWGDSTVQPWLGDLTVSNAGSSSVISNAVPVPAAVWLLGSGLLGIVGIRKRHNTDAQRSRAAYIFSR